MVAGVEGHITLEGVANAAVLISAQVDRWPHSETVTKASIRRIPTLYLS